MTPLLFTLCAALASVFAGFVGSLVGIGGGVIVVPVLTLALGVDIRHAISASIVAVVATSSAAASTYVRERMANLRLGMFLELSTTLGAMTGALVAGYLSPKFLYILFGCLASWTAWHMAKKAKDVAEDLPPDALADKLLLHSSFFDKAQNREVAYRVTRSKLGLGVGAVAGILSGLLGIGGGAVKVPVMHLAMGVPIKAATATSNFMIGITAATGAAVYFARGDLLPFVAAPVAVGIIAGSKLGSKLLGRTESRLIRGLFVAVLGVMALQLLYKGVTL
jgi:hypothetical protein